MGQLFEKAKTNEMTAFEQLQEYIDKDYWINYCYSSKGMLMQLMNAFVKEREKDEAIAFAKFMGGYGGRALLSQKYEQWEQFRIKQYLK